VLYAPESFEPLSAEPWDEERVRAGIQAIVADAHYPEPHKTLGMLLLKRGDKQEARNELQQYLQLAPQASDRAYVEQELHNLLQM